MAKRESDGTFATEAEAPIARRVVGVALRVLESRFDLRRRGLAPQIDPHVEAGEEAALNLMRLWSKKADDELSLMSEEAMLVARRWAHGTELT